jgi:hypothetical protein
LLEGADGGPWSQPQVLTYAGILDEDPFFAQFKPSSIRQNISFIKKEHAQRDHVEGISKCKLTIFVLSNITLTENDNPTPSASNVAKRLPAAAELQEAQKKQAVDGKLNPFKPVINQTVVTDSMCFKKVIMTVALPGNVINRDQIIV